MMLAVDDKLESLVLDLLEWIAKEPRTYRQTMDVWRTSCPRLAVWEEAINCGLVVRKPSPDGMCVKVTAKGSRFLVRRGRMVARP